MNLTKIFRTLSVSLVVGLGWASPSQAAVSVFFSSGATCTNQTSNVQFTPGGAPVQVSLCMSTDTESTCGHTVVLQTDAPANNGKFVVTSSSLGPNYFDANSTVTPTPLAINSPGTPADFGGTSNAPVAHALNQLLNTFTLAPQASATGGPYVVSLSSVSIVAVDVDTTCGGTTVPTEASISASLTLTRNPLPAFTSASSTTFSSAVGSSNSFAVTATASPAPTLSAGALPSGIAFNTSTGILSGTPAAGGPYTIVFTATSNGNSVQQTFTLNVSTQASQTITFTNPGSQTFSATPIALSAVGGGSGNPVTFSTQSPSVCSVVGSNATMLTIGSCTLVANQAAGGNYAAALPAPVTFNISGTVPGAPTIGTGTPGDTQAIIAFTPPASTGGLAISYYTATCAGVGFNKATSPITVTGLTNGTPYQCTVTATNSQGSSLPSAPVSVTPAAASALVALGVKSRKTHAAAGVFDLPIDMTQPITGTVTTEPRLVGGGHVLVFEFNNPITTVAGATAAAVDNFGAAIGGTPTISFTPGSSEVVVTFTTAIPDKSRLTLTLSNVNNAGTSVAVSLGFLAGDSNNTRVVNVGDVLGASGRSGNPIDQTNFRYDFNLNGVINVGDVLGITGRSGNVLN